MLNYASDVEKLFEFLITRHSKIKFTLKKKNSKQISCPNQTVIGLFASYLSFKAFSYKVGLVRTLLSFNFMISST